MPSVTPMPFLKIQLLDNNGSPAAGGLLGTFAAGTTTPLATYSDAAGTILNANPVVADAAGRMAVFLTDAAYKLTFSLADGTQLWSIDQITSSELSLLASNNVWTGTNTFQAAVETQSSFTADAGITSAGPNNLSGGGSLAGTFTGSPTFSGTPNFSGGLTLTDLTVSGQITSTLTTGTPPFVVASTTQVANLNASNLEGDTWEAPGTIGSTTPSTGAFTTVTVDGVAITGTPSAGEVLTASGSSAAGWATPAAQISIQEFTDKILGAPVSLTGGVAAQIDSISVTMPASGGPWRAQVTYGYYQHNGTTYVSWTADDQGHEWNMNEGTVTDANSMVLSTSAMSPSSYANGSTVVFSVHVKNNGSATIETTDNIDSSHPSRMQVQVLSTV